MTEDMNHLYVRCNDFGRLWSLVTNWLGVKFVGHNLFFDHWMQFAALGGFSKRDYLYCLVFYGMDN